MDIQIDVVIVGAGLAGLSTAIATSDIGMTTLVVDSDDIGTGSSGVPIGLINPAAAKQANLSWNAKHCISAVRELLNTAHSHSDRHFFRKSGVLRPSVDKATFEAFSTSLKRHAYPSGWARWLDREELDAFHPGLDHAGGALWVNEGFTVDVPEYLRALVATLQHQGMQVLTGTKVIQMTWLEDVQKWELTLNGGRKAHTSHMIKATGSSILDDTDWKWMPVHTIKGQMAVFRSSNEITWTHAIAAHGFVAHLNGYDWVVGSTFEHKFDNSAPDSAGLQSLENKVDSILPHLRPISTLQHHWAGMRLGTPNRLPIVGRHPTLPGQWVLTGLGSKGLLYAAYLGRLLAQNIRNGSPIPAEVSTDRLINIQS